MRAVVNPGYRPEIDGLRALAVVPVVLFHAGVPGFSGGYVGVDVFFVISGYLITGIIQRDIDAGRFSILQFYERRARRILPALLATCLVAAAMAWVLFLPEDMLNFAQSLVALSLFSSNVLFWLESGYFDAAAHVKPLLHTWSLSIEEQFYVLFPMVLILLARADVSRRITIIALAVAVSFALSVWGSYAYPSAAFYLLPFRGWELGLGCLLALVSTRGAVERLSGGWSTALGIGALGLVLVPVFVFDNNTRFPGAAAVLPCAGTAALIWITQSSKGAVHSLLAAPGLVRIGLISYSLYLWHWVLIVFARYYLNDNLPAAWIVVIVLVSFVCAELSWRFVETPLRRKQMLPGRSVLLAAAVAGLLLLAFAGLYGTFQEGLPQRIPSVVLDSGAGAEDLNPRREKCHAGLTDAQVRSDDICVLGSAATAAPRYLVWGDSHAEAMMAAFDEQALARGQAGWYVSRADCPPLVNVVRLNEGNGKGCPAFAAEVLALVERKRPTAVVLVARWPVYAVGWPEGGVETGPDPFIGFSLQDPATAQASSAAFAAAFADTVAALEGLGAQVWVLHNVPEQRVTPIRNAWALWLGSRASPGLPRAFHEARLATVAPVFAAHNVRVLDVSDALCSEVHCLMEMSGHVLYRDEDHLNLHGAHIVAPELTPLFDSLSGAGR